MPKKKLVINPLPKILDYVQEDTRPFPPFTRYFSGRLSELLADPEAYNLVDAGKLPKTSTRQIMDLGKLKNICEEEN